MAIPQATTTLAEPARQDDHTRRRKPVMLASVAAVLYSAITAVYIAASSEIAAALAEDIPQLARWEVFKGLVFVLVNGLIFFSSVWLLLRQIVSNRLELEGHRERLIVAENRARRCSEAAAGKIQILNEQLHQQLKEHERLIQQLESKNNELERFTYTVSHDLKAPLVTIRGFASLAQQDSHAPDGEALKQDIDRISSAAEMMDRLLNDLLQLSRIGRSIQKTERVPLASLAREAAALCSTAALKNGVTVEIQPNLPDVSCDATRIREVFQNLIDNAIKFSKPGAEHNWVRIDAAADADEHWVSCCVSDNGIGLKDELREKIFEVFEQADPKKGGSGIGLAIVKRIVEVHGGRIWVESDGPGAGCRFYFTLPAGTD